MLTVKVMRSARHHLADGSDDEKDYGRFHTRIVEASVVNIFTLRPGELMEVAGHNDKDGTSFAFYITPPLSKRPEGFADEVDFWSSAFVENSAGATTETVRF